MTPVACDDLKSKAGTWQNISPAQLREPRNMEAFTVVVNPKDGTVYAMGSNQTNDQACPECPKSMTGILRSSDCGATFTRVNDGTEGTDSAKLNTGTLWALLIHPTDPRVLFAVNGYGNDPTVYKSTDSGVTWRKLDAGLPFAQAIAIDPQDGNHLAATFHEDCKPPLRPWCFSRSQDGGETWTLFNGPASIPGSEIGGWTEGASINILGKSAYIVVSANGIWYTGDAGATWLRAAADSIYVGYPGAVAHAGGRLLVPGTNDVYMSAAAAGSDPPFALAKGTPLTAIPESPSVTAFVVAGDLVIAGNAREGQRPLWKTSAAAPETGWQQFEQDICKGTLCRGPNQLAYDPTHRVVYAANWGAGLWRYVLE